MKPVWTIALVWMLLSAGAVRAEPAFTLNRYSPGALPHDGFVLRRPKPLGHLRVAAQLHGDYALRPLQFERFAGDDDPIPLVKHQGTVNAMASLGLFERYVVTLGLPVHVLLAGDPLQGQPQANGFGSGDVFIGGRMRLGGEEGGPMGAARAMLTLPSGSGADGPAVTGEDGASFNGELIGEVPFGRVSWVANLGLRFRPQTRIDQTRFGDELTFGTSVIVRAVPDLLETHLELFGAAALDDAAGVQSTPLEAGLGAKCHFARDWTVGATGGAGLLPAFGSPQLRVALMVGYQTPTRGHQQQQPAEDDDADDARAERDTEPQEQTPVEPVEEMPPEQDPETRDSDGDGLTDLSDQCPLVPGDSGDMGCARTFAYDPAQGQIVFERGLRFERRSGKLDREAALIVTELAALLTAHPDFRIRIDAHVRGRGRSAAEAQASVQRAMQVGEALQAQGVEPGRFDLFGCGSNRPLGTGSSARSRRNERVEVWVTQPLPPTGMRSSVGCTPAE